jgi:uroporphyrinogen-III synthase
VELRGRTVAVQHYGETNLELRGALEERGAAVRDLHLYRWALPEDEGPVVELVDALARGEVACVAVTSQAQVANLFAIAQSHGRDGELRRVLAGPVLVAAVGPVCARALEAEGVRAGVVAAPPKMGPLVLAIAEALAPVTSD